MEHIQNTIAAINHQRAIRIKFRNHSVLTFSSVTEKLAVVERLLWYFGRAVVDVASVRRFKQELMY